MNRILTAFTVSVMLLPFSILQAQEPPPVQNGLVDLASNILESLKSAQNTHTEKQLQKMKTYLELATRELDPKFQVSFSESGNYRCKGTYGEFETRFQFNSDRSQIAVGNFQINREDPNGTYTVMYHQFDQHVVELNPTNTYSGKTQYIVENGPMSPRMRSATFGSTYISVVTKISNVTQTGFDLSLDATKDSNSFMGQLRKDILSCEIRN